MRRGPASAEVMLPPAVARALEWGDRNAEPRLLVQKFGKQAMLASQHLAPLPQRPQDPQLAAGGVSPRFRPAAPPQAKTGRRHNSSKHLRALSVRTGAGASTGVS